GRRLPGDGSDGRHRYHRRGRGVDRIRRRRWRVPRRPPIRRCDTRTRVLRARWDASDLDGRTTRVGLPARDTEPRRWGNEPRPATLAGRAATRGRAAGALGGGSRARGAADPEVRHVPGDRTELRAARVRPT